MQAQTWSRRCGSEVLKFGLQKESRALQRGFKWKRLLPTARSSLSLHKTQIRCRARNFLVISQVPRLGAVWLPAEVNRGMGLCAALLLQLLRSFSIPFSCSSPSGTPLIQTLVCFILSLGPLDYSYFCYSFFLSAVRLGSFCYLAFQNSHSIFCFIWYDFDSF